MTARNLLPPSLGTSFRVSQALAAGASRKRLQARDLWAGYHGIRSTHPDLVRGLVPAMSSEFAFGGPTAASIWSLPLPRRWAVERTLFVSTTGTARIRRSGVVSTRRTFGDVAFVNGVPVLDPVSTWMSLGGLLHPRDLAAVGDRLVGGTLRTPALASVADLRQALVRAGRIVGLPALRCALDDVRVGSWSRPESLLRLLISRAGLPELSLNVPVQLEGGGEAFPDLSWPAFRIAIEYDGRWHEDLAQRAADLERHERLVDVGWMVVHVRRADLFGAPSTVIARLVRRLRDRGFTVARPIDWSRMPRFEA